MNKNNNRPQTAMLNILFLGLVSFFTDISTEMVYPLIPLYLTAVFGATPALVGIIEGIAESLASLLKVYSGYISDKFQKKKALALSGYATGLIYKCVLLIAGSWVGVLFARVIDRFGKGIRTVPRDVIVDESADKNSLGKAFGLHKALDMAGSAIGILITFFLVGSGFSGYKNMFLISMIPAVLGLFMFFFVKEKKTDRTHSPRQNLFRSLKGLDKRLKLYLLVVFLFTLGNSSNAFLILKAKSVGFGSGPVILLYFLYNATAAALSFSLGRLSDKMGRKTLLVSGYLVFSVVYFGIAFAGNRPFIIAMFALYGVYTAIITGAERAFVSEIAPDELKGTMLGLQSTMAGIALLPASIITGLLWSTFGAVMPFVFGAALSLAAALILMFCLKSTIAKEDI